MKSERLLSALILLQGHGRLSTRQIAERLEISQRTAHRDMEALCAAGIPLIAHRGVQGGWELSKGWRTQVPGLNDTELQGLLMAQPGALGSSTLKVAAQRAYDKLIAALPASSRTQADSIRARLHFDPAGWRGPAEDLSMLPIVQEALACDHKLTFLYTRADGEAGTRTVDPLGIVCKQAVWYLVARVPAGMRTYRISRMRDAMVLAIPFERPSGFELAAHWREATETLKEQRQPFVTILALSPQGVAELQPWCWINPIKDHAAEPKIPKDWVVMEVQFESMHQARFVVLGLGLRAIPLGPPDFCRGIAAEVRNMTSVHSILRYD